MLKPNCFFFFYDVSKYIPVQVFLKETTAIFHWSCDVFYQFPPRMHSEVLLKFYARYSLELFIVRFENLVFSFIGV